MFEHSKLQEIYTGALIAAKGKHLNGIKEITQVTRFKYEDWVRVRFGAGTPWRKCWAVVSQPDEKAVKKAKAAAKKAKKSAYEYRPVLKGDIKFYDNKKTKKQQPIATMVDAFAAYALYPQSKQLIEQSSLVKLEGKIMIHGDQPTESEGFVFVMPDTHPMVTGFESMLRFLFPAFDTFALYGRPGMLVADNKDGRSLMFAMPREGSVDCGYLDVVDVVNLIVQHGASLKLESEWREKLKKLTEDKIRMLSEGRSNRPRTSLPALSKNGQLTFQNGLFPSSTSLPPVHDLPPQHVPMKTPPASSNSTTHQRSVSDMTGLRVPNQSRPRSMGPSALNNESFQDDSLATPSENSDDDGLFQVDPAARQLQNQTISPPPEPVPVTPLAQHAPSSRPPQPLRSPRADPGYNEDNLFAGVVPPRNDRSSYHESLQPTGNQYYQGQGNPAQQLSNPRNSTIDAPPGYALQNSHVLLRGPPPTDDEKSGYNDNHSNRTPSEQPGMDAYNQRHSQQWQQPPSGSPQDDQDHSGVPSSPPIPAKGPIQGGPNRPPPLNTNFERKPVPVSTATPSSVGTPDSELRAHLIDETALDRIGPNAGGRQPFARVDSQDEDTLDRRAIERIQRVLAGGGDSESEYGEGDEDDEPDYASVASEPPPTKRDVEQPRAGRMKVVGQKAEEEVRIGDITYRPQSSGKSLDPTAIVPKVDFGQTVNHGRTLSSEIKGVNRGNATQYDPDIYPVSQHGTLMGGTLPSTGDPRRLSSQNLTPEGYSAQQPGAGSRSSGGSDERPRPSPDRGNARNSDLNESKRRSMVWQPGMTQTGPSTPNLHTASAEQYVSEKAAAAHNEARNRYLHKRRSSGQLLNATGANRNSSYEQLPTRPQSRGGTSAFMPHGLVSTPDLSQHLSAREQEFVARQTGGKLVQMDSAQKPPHKAGLIGAIHSREQEKQHMKDTYSQGRLANNMTVQQEIVRRQQEQARIQAQKDQQIMARRTTPSPRPLSTAYDQQSYFPPQQPQQQQYYQPQQQPQQYQTQYQQQQYQQQQLSQQQQFSQQQSQYGRQPSPGQQMPQNQAYQSGSGYYSR